MAIVVNINQSGAKAATPEQIKEASRRSWVVSDYSLERYGDKLLSVRQNTVVGAYRIDDWERETDGKVAFDLSPDPDQSTVGEESPVRWTRGQANPVKLFDLASGQPEASTVEETAQGNRRVKLDGWTLVAYPDGRARIQAPDDKRKLIVESAFPGPKGGNVTVRLLADEA